MYAIKFELEISWPTVANKSDLEVCLYFFNNRLTCLAYISAGFLPDKVKIWRNYKS